MDNFEDLASAYGNFLAPVLKIYSENNLVTSTDDSKADGIMTSNVSITLNMNSASSASFNVVGDYDIVSRSFKKTLSVGAKISIEIGYGSKLSTIFVGYVDSIDYAFSENPSISVTAFDAIKLMLAAGDTKMQWDDGKLYTDTLKAIIGKYSDICPMPDTNVHSSDKTHGLLMQNSNDYEYVTRLCKYCDMIFMIKSGKGHIIDINSQNECLTQLGPGKGLLSLSVSSGYKKVKAQVTGDKLQKAYGESEVETGQNSGYKYSMNKPQIITEQAPLKTNDECKLLAKRLAGDAVKEVQTAKGVCVGIPEIVPGVGLQFDVDEEWSKRTYFVNTAVHNFSTSGYTVSFTTKGWEDKKK